MNEPQQSPTTESGGQVDSGRGRTRRLLLKLFLGTGIVASLASFLYPVLRFIVPPPRPDLGASTAEAGQVGELKPNSGKIFRFGRTPGLLVLKPKGEYRAMSAVCTHLGCIVQYRADRQLVWCACHDGWYDLNGRNIAGPPPRPLELYEVHVQADKIMVERRREA